MKKINTFFKSKFAKIAMSCLLIVTIVATMAIGCFAADTVDYSTEAVSGITTIFGNITSVFTFANIVKMLAIAITAAAGLTLSWFGLRKVVAMIQKALKKGRVSV